MAKASGRRSSVQKPKARKLTLNKESLKNLTPHGDDAVKGGTQFQTANCVITGAGGLKNGTFDCPTNQDCRGYK